MKPTIKLLIMLTLLALLLIPAAPALAKGPFDGGPIIFGGNYTLKSGDTLEGDLVVFGGNVTIEEGAQVNGSIVVFGGNVSLDGTITGDLVLIGGTGSLGEKAVIKGDLVTIGGSLNRAEGSRVEGEIRNEPTIVIPAPTVPQPPTAPEPPPLPDFTKSTGLPNFVGSAFGVLGQAVLCAALAMLLVLFLHPQMDRVAQAIVRQPLVSGGVGLLTVFLLPFTLLLLVVTILLIPVAILAVLALVIAWLFGAVSIGMEVGERFTRSINQTWSPVLTTGFGTFLVVLVLQGLGLIPCVGWLASFLVGVTGLGAVLLAFFGSRANRPMAAAPAPGPDEALPPPA